MDINDTGLWIKLQSHLDHTDYDAVKTLETLCMQHDSISLKLELDYKLEDAKNSEPDNGLGKINECMVFDGDMLIGYAGICGFGSVARPLEITGMVHPEYRRKGIFTRLHMLVMAECKRRNASGALGLCDRASATGQAFIQSIGSKYQCSEFEMVYRGSLLAIDDGQRHGIRFRKATNADAKEIARQNKIYFGGRRYGERR